MLRTLYDGRQVGGVGRHAARRVFAVSGVQLASSAAAAAAAAAAIGRLRRAATTTPSGTFAPQVGSAIDAGNVQQRDAFQRRTAAEIERASVTLRIEQRLRSLQKIE